MAKVIAQRPVLYWAATLVIGVFLGMILVGRLSAAAPPDGISVTELNVDGNGDIAVHEQGVVPVTDNDSTLSVDDDSGSLSVDDSDGSLTVDDGAGSLSVDDGNGVLTVDGTVSVSEPVTVDGTVNVAGGGFFALTEDAPSFTTTSRVGENVSLSTAGLDRITTLSLYTINNPAGIRVTFEENTVGLYFAQPGAPLQIAFPHPLIADGINVHCFSTSPCQGGFSFSGYSSSTP